MRSRSSLPAAALMLASGFAAFGCQFISGLTVIEVTGTGGGGGSGGSMSASGSGGTGAGEAKKELGAGCTSGDECGSGFCTEKVCCLQSECPTCASCAVPGKQGSCQVTEGASCGTKTDDECDGLNTCTAAGVCLDFAPTTTACGGTCEGDVPVLAGTCDGAGTCTAKVGESCSPFACDTSGGSPACRKSCDMQGGCADEGVCLAPPGQMGVCFPCGKAPMPKQCVGCDSCAGGICATVCNSAADCPGPKLDINTIDVPARVECKNQCNDITIACGGAQPCTVVCESGGCTNLKLLCSPNGPCSLDCKAGACKGAIKITCGDNACAATCAESINLDQTCGGACSCVKTGCEGT